MSEPMCGEADCPLCPTLDDFDRYLVDKDREDRRVANLMLGLPEDFGLATHTERE